MHIRVLDFSNTEEYGNLTLFLQQKLTCNVLILISHLTVFCSVLFTPISYSTFHFYFPSPLPTNFSLYFLSPLSRSILSLHSIFLFSLILFSFSLHFQSIFSLYFLLPLSPSFYSIFPLAAFTLYSFSTFSSYFRTSFISQNFLSTF